MKVIFSTLFLSVLIMAGFTGCKKSGTDVGLNPNTTGGQAFGYGGSVFYLKSADYTISPNTTKAGNYTAFPDNLRIDNSTGKITVTAMGLGDESQTGLRYKIKFQATGSTQIDSTFIVLAGINYLDRIYYLTQHDSIVSPIYNAGLANMPAGNYGIQANNKLAIDPVSGKINLKECMRRGLFNTPALNGEWEEETVLYTSNDNSGSVMNRIDIALYFYTSINQVPSNISTVMRAHQNMVLGVAQSPIPNTTGAVDNDLPNNLSLFKPRPPCIIIIAN